VHVISSEESTETSDALMEVSPDFTRVTVAPVAKFFPSSAVISTVAPVAPFSGVISDILGAAEEDVVAVVATVVVVVDAIFDEVVAIVVGFPTGTADTSMVPDFSVYRVSTVERLTVSVLESSRYPQLPSVLG
jgi:hypothetical protein